jgi:D-glycero-D-manno-heptose 1,7-bisphosphate phosphatase
MINRAAFLDRDGVINQKPTGDGYVTRWEDMRFLPGTAECIALLNRTGFRVIVVSNQRCVAKGLLTSQLLDSMHQRMLNWFAAAGATIDGIYYCPHEIQPPCTCRKPSPGMLLTAARDHKLDLRASWMIGDSEIDVEAGRNAGCKTVRLMRRLEERRSAGDVLAQSLPEAIDKILQREGVIVQSQL